MSVSWLGAACPNGRSPAKLCDRFPRGALRRIFHETDRAWVDASYASNAGWIWIRDGQAFIVLSEKDGWRHAYVYSRDGKELALLTPGKFDIIERAVVDEGGGWFYFCASPDNATQNYLYRARLDGAGTPERVTPMNQPGTHDYQFSPDAKWAFYPKDYAGPYLFTDPDGGSSSTTARPFPCRLTERVTLRNLTTTSGRKPRMSPDPAVAASVRVIELN